MQHHHPGLDFIRPQVFLSEGRNDEPHNMDGHTNVSPQRQITIAVSHNQQAKLLDAFRTGHVNLLVVTAVAESGIDIPAATCVVRCDCYMMPSSI